MKSKKNKKINYQLLYSDLFFVFGIVLAILALVKLETGLALTAIIAILTSMLIEMEERIKELSWKIKNKGRT